MDIYSAACKHCVLLLCILPEVGQSGGPASLEWEDWLKKNLTSEKIKHRVCMKDQFRTDNNLKTKTVNHAKLLNCNPKK